MRRGEMLCGYEVTPGMVLYVSEESQSRWAKRRDALGIDDNVYFLSRPFKGKPTMAKWRAFIAFIENEADRIGANLIVFDTLSALWPVANENDAGEVQAALMPLWNLASKFAVLLVHHLKKGDGTEGTGSRGSGALPGFVDTIMELRRHDPNDRQCRKRVITGYGRDEETPAEVVVELDPETNEYRCLGDRKSMKREEIRQTILTILPRERPGLTLDEIKESWPEGEFPRKGEMLQTLADGAEEHGDWTRDGTGKKGNPYRYFLLNRDDF
jgi:AAA domain-containing protein